MANETLALARQSPDDAPSEHDYQSFCAVLSDSARGRAFLAEYARRNRHADTQVLLAALDRLEALARSHTAAPDADRIQPEINGCAAVVKTAKLMALLELVQRRIAEIVAPAQDTPPDKPSAPTVAEEPAADVARSHLAVVPPADEPELPIPSPASAQPPPIALVGQDPAQPKHPEKTWPGLNAGWEPVFGHDHAQANNNVRTITIMPEVTFVGSAPPKAAVVEPAVVEQAVAAPLAPPAVAATSAAAQSALPVPEAIENNVPAPKTQAVPPPADPLAAIMALSEDERIALFT